MTCQSLTEIAGGWAVLTVFLKGWGEKECSQAYDDLVKLAFTPHVTYPLWLVSWLVNMAASVVLGSRYSARGINEALQSVFGLDQTIDQPSFASRQGVKIALPVVSVPGNVHHVFNNYNGFKRSAASGSKHCKDFLPHLGSSRDTHLPLLVHDSLSAPEIGLGVRLWEM